MGQRIAILTPDNVTLSHRYAELLGDELNDGLTVIDPEMARSAYLSVDPATPFNMPVDEASTLGKVIGCDQFILLRSATMRRSAFGRPEYYEALSAIHVVSSRTGRMVLWRLRSFEAAKPAEAERSLIDDIKPLAAEIKNVIRMSVRDELNDKDTPMEEPPEEGSPAAKGFRAPIPYRRIKPEYSTIAALYDVTATVEILVDLDSAGNILKTRIVRWAGYGLEESVEAAVRKMNWRPAERNGKTLPMRFLLRYNFKKLEKDR